MSVVFPAPVKRIIQRTTYFRYKNGDAPLGPKIPNSCPGSTRPLIPSRMILSSSDPLDPLARRHLLLLLPYDRGMT